MNPRASPPLLKHSNNPAREALTDVNRAGIKEEARQRAVDSPHRTQSLSFPENSDPVIRESQILIQLYSGHVARGASLRSHIRLMPGHFVT